MAYKTVWGWEKRLRSQGPHSWREAKHPGGPRNVDEKQLKRLREILREGALAPGFATDLWTLKRAAEVTEKDLREEYTRSGVWHVLRDLGLSAQVPVPRTLERAEAYIRHWRRGEWPEIQREARRTRATLLFVDESFVPSEHKVRRTW